jgi:hypothetical protein
MILTPNLTKNEAFIFKAKEIIFLFFLWLLLFIEPIPIGGLKISQIWKGIFVVILLIQIIKEKIPLFVWIGILFSLKFLLYSSIPYGFMNNFRLFTESLVFPVLLGFLYVKIQKQAKLSYEFTNFAILLSLFLLYSAVPFFFGLKSYNTEFDLTEKYNINFSATKGLFYHIASASKMFTIATVFIILNKSKFNHRKIYKMFWWFSIMLGTFLIIMCWTRTGWFIYGMSIIIILFYYSTFKQKLKGIILLLCCFTIVTYVFEKSEAFRWRLTGGTSYRGEQELSVTQLASARLPYIVTSIGNMQDEGLFGTFIGYGEQKGKDYFEKKLSMSITSHNATFEIIEANGILGLILYLWFMRKVLYGVKKKVLYLEKIDKKTVLICIFLFLSFYITSHGTPLWGEIIYALVFMDVYQKYKFKFQTT